MRCTDNMDMSLSSTSRRGRKYKTKRRKQTAPIKQFLVILFLILIVIAIGVGFKMILNQSVVTKYEKKNYNTALYEAELFSDDICVVTDNVSYDAFQTEDEFYSSALFNLEDDSVLLAENMHEKVYPASTTKLMTFHLALKYGNLDDIVTISKTATILPSGSSRAWLKVSDQMSLRDLLYSMMIASGNDSAIAIAEYISGSEEEFAKLMNEEAKLLGATNTNFVNSHGYHDDNHYTTAYDLYLIMNQCLKYDEFLELISTETYKTAITEPNGYQRKVEWIQTNFFLNGMYEVPEGVTVIGGKTGTTDEAKNCLMLYCLDKDSVPHLAIIMGAETRDDLYKNMSSLISTLSN